MNLNNLYLLRTKKKHEILKRFTHDTSTHNCFTAMLKPHTWLSILCYCLSKLFGSSNTFTANITNKLKIKLEFFTFTDWDLQPTQIQNNSTEVILYKNGHYIYRTQHTKMWIYILCVDWIRDHSNCKIQHQQSQILWLANSLPQSIKNLSDKPKQFKSALQNYWYACSFYSIEEYFNVKREW